MAPSLANRCTQSRLATSVVLLLFLSSRAQVCADEDVEDEEEIQQRRSPRRRADGPHVPRGSWDAFANTRRPTTAQLDGIIEDDYPAAKEKGSRAGGRRGGRRSSEKGGGEDKDPMGEAKEGRGSRGSGSRGGRRGGSSRRRETLPLEDEEEIGKAPAPFKSSGGGGGGGGGGKQPPLKAMQAKDTTGPPPYCGGAPAHMIPFDANIYTHASKPIGGRGRRRLAEAADAAEEEAGQVWEGEVLERPEAWGAPAPGEENCTGAEGEGGLEGLSPEAAESRRKLLRLGFTMKKVGCSMNREVKVLHENEGSGPNQRRDIRLGEKPLIDCLNDVSKCGAEAQQLARGLPSAHKFANQARVRLGGARTFRTCALVGNAGHITKKQYGQYINKHDVVVRFNVQKVGKFSKSVGSKTTYRVLNNARSVDACCQGMMPEKKAGLIFWFPANRPEMKRVCKRKLPGSGQYWLSRSFILKEVATMNAYRRDLKRLGFSGFKSWRQLTSGGHAVLLFAKLCDYVSVYGFTTYPAKGPDQYGGRAKKTMNGQIWHDWVGEKLAWRLMSAQGNLQICSL